MARTTDPANAEYRALCEKYSVPLFHQPWWMDATCHRWIGVVAKSGDGIGIWPVPLERKLGVRMSRNPALTAYLGPVTLSAVGYSANVTPTLLSGLLRQLPSLPVWAVAGMPGDWPSEDFHTQGFSVGARPTFLLALAGRSTDELLGATNSEVRRKIRRGVERFAIADEPGAAAEVYALQQATLHRKGTRAYHSVEYFSRLVDAAHSRGAGALWTARLDGQLVGAQWSLWDTQCCYNMALARNEQFSERFVSEALLWHAIHEAHARGIAVFDFEGSSIPTIAQFFAGFGSTRHTYLTLRKNTSPVWQLVRRLRG